MLLLMAYWLNMGGLQCCMQMPGLLKQWWHKRRFKWWFNFRRDEQ